MCGISGIFYNKPIESQIIEQEIERINESQMHRGPDGKGIHIDDSFGLGHRRLSIIDLENGKQPMYAENKKVIITFNGEIYNYKILRIELEKKGYVFETNSDTEVLLKSYLEWGTELLQKIRGMFAFIICDKRNDRVFTARDHFGIKPIIYRVESNYVAFASEINALKLINNTPPVGLLSSVESFLRYGYIPGKSTIYKNVFKLLPGQYSIGTINNPLQKIEYYFRYQPEKAITKSAIDKLVSKTIEESVVLHTQSDVPYGVFLSGGIDSTIVAAYANKNSKETIKGFTMDFSDKNSSEILFAEKAAKHSGYELHSTIFDDKIENYLNKIVFQYGEPFGDSSALPTWQISALAAKHVKVVLSGDGGDEAFAGYAGKYSNQMMISPMHRWKHAWHTNIKNEYIKAAYTLLKNGLVNNKKLTIAAIHNFAGYSNNQFIWNHNYRSLAAHTNKDLIKLSADYNEADLLFNFRKLDIDTFMPFDINVKVDIASMANSIEVRPPLLDKEVYALAASIPSSELLTYVDHKLSGKEPLKKLLASLGYDKNFIYRNKKGFTIPKLLWFNENGIATKMLRNEINRKDNILIQWFNIDAINQLLNKKEKKYNEANKLWYLLILSIWQKQHKDVKFIYE